MEKGSRNYDNVVQPEEIIKSLGLTYSDSQIEQLDKRFPTSTSSYMMVPGPPEPMSLSDIHSLRPNIINNRKQTWENGRWVYGPCLWGPNPKDAFLTKEKVGFGWLALNNKVFSSKRKTWDDQKIMPPIGERVPTAVEMMWIALVRHEIKKEMILWGSMRRTASINHRGNCIILCAQQEDIGVNMSGLGDLFMNPNNLEDQDLLVAYLRIF